MAELSNPAVPTSVLENILRWKQAGATFEDVLHRLRLKCVPPNIVPKPWMPGQFAASSWHTHMYIFTRAKIYASVSTYMHSVVHVLALCLTR